MPKCEYRVVFGRYETLACKGYEQIQEPTAAVLFELGEEILIELPVRSSIQRFLPPQNLADMYGRWARTWVVNLWKKTALHHSSWSPELRETVAVISRAVAISKTVEDWRSFGAAVHTILQLHGMHAAAAFLDGYDS